MSLRFRSFSARSLVLFFSAALVAVAPPVGAQQDATVQVQRMNKRAMTDYDSLEFELARKTLMDAVSMLRQAGIDESPIAAKTYLNLGVVYVAGFKDRNRGMQQFVQALKINPQLKLDPAVASPELDEVFIAARKQVGGSATPPPQREPATDPDGDKPEPKGLQHSPVDEARTGEPLLIKAQLGEGSGASRMFLFYRASGQSDFTSVTMKNNGSGEWSASIPGDAIEDRPLQYYIEARDKKGRAVSNAGSAPSPYIVTISETAPGARIVHREDKQPGKKSSSDGPAYHRLFVNVMPGFGFGVHPSGNVTEVAFGHTNGSASYQHAAVRDTGGAISPFHIAVELGGNITRHFSLSALGRFQVVTGANAQTIYPDTGANITGPTSKAGGAVAGFLRARYRFLDGKLHPYVHIDFGGGEIRNALNLSSNDPKSEDYVDESTAIAYNADPNSKKVRQLVCADKANCYDTIKLGYLFVGGGAGISYDVWKYIAVMFDLNLLGAIGVGNNGQNAMQVDFQLGVGAHFL